MTSPSDVTRLSQPLRSRVAHQPQTRAPILPTALPTHPGQVPHHPKSTSPTFIHPALLCTKSIAPPLPSPPSHPLHLHLHIMDPTKDKKSKWRLPGLSKSSPAHPPSDASDPSRNSTHDSTYSSTPSLTGSDASRAPQGGQPLSQETYRNDQGQTVTTTTTSEFLKR